MNTLRKTTTLFQYSRFNFYRGPPRRFMFTDQAKNLIYNSNNRLRLEEENYCNDYSTPLKAPFQNTLNSVSNETIKNFDRSFMMVSEVQAKLLHQLVKLLQPVSVLEIGGFTGYSAVAIGSALPPKARLDSLELEEKHAAVAVKYIKEAGLHNSVKVLVGPAGEGLASLNSLNRKYDLIFIDADKTGYVDYFNFIMENDMLTKKGVIIADNVLKSGQVHRLAGYEPASPAPDNEVAMAKALHNFNERVFKDPRVDVLILPLFDGLSIIRRIDA